MPIPSQRVEGELSLKAARVKSSYKASITPLGGSGYQPRNQGRQVQPLSFSDWTALPRNTIPDRQLTMPGGRFTNPADADISRCKAGLQFRGRDPETPKCDSDVNCWFSDFLPLYHHLLTGTVSSVCSASIGTRWSTQSPQGTSLITNGTTMAASSEPAERSYAILEEPGGSNLVVDLTILAASSRQPFPDARANRVHMVNRHQGPGCNPALQPLTKPDAPRGDRR